jgi:formiminoglutamase
MTSSFVDPYWPTASAWLAGDRIGDPCGTIGLLGVPISKGAITPGRCDLAPSAIRAALARFSTYDLGTGQDLRELTVRDFGDIAVAQRGPAESAAEITAAVRNAVGNVDALAVLGGDNSVTRPCCLGSEDVLADCGLLTIDAHLDLRDLAGGLNNGNPIRALLGDGLPGSQIVQIGLQPFANSAAYARVAHEAGITVVTAERAREVGIGTIVADALAKLAQSSRSIYVDVDIDVLDRVFAPATPGSRPGGLAPWELLAAVRRCGSHPKVRLVDFVEVDPSKDVADSTVFVAASCLLAFAAGLHARLSGPPKLRRPHLATGIE